jgi:hypothetical protein
MVFGSQHSRTMTVVTGSFNQNHRERYNID